MEWHFVEWLNLLLRWAHVLFGIAWIGSSFYFMWLDSHLEKAAPQKLDVEGELWMVHSGGFYLVERKRIAPGMMPPVLHWFKYEALFTLITGLFLLGLIYHLTGGAYLIDPGISGISPAKGTLIGLGTLVVSWFAYDWLWQSRLARYSVVASTLSLLLAAAAAILLTKTLSGRAAFIHFGAMLATWMVANVWVRILPAQQKMLDATKMGLTPDYTLSGKAKRRSVHNTYLTFPVIFTMLSNHYPYLYASAYSWAVLLLLFVFGAAIRHVMIAKNAMGRWAIAPAVFSFFALIWLTSTRVVPVAVDGGAAGKVTFAQVWKVIELRCIKCHSTNPEIKTFGPSPGGVHFDSPRAIQALKERIKFRAVTSKTMPLANITGITDEERGVIGRWIDQGARIDE